MTQYSQDEFDSLFQHIIDFLPSADLLSGAERVCKVVFKDL